MMCGLRYKDVEFGGLVTDVRVLRHVRMRPDCPGKVGSRFGGPRMITEGPELVKRSK